MGGPVSVPGGDCFFPRERLQWEKKGGCFMEKQRPAEAGALPKKYKKEFGHSYALGPFPTFELLRHRPRQARAVYCDETFRDREKLEALCRELGVPFRLGRKALERIAQKEVCYAAGEFWKYPGRLGQGVPHVALVEPSDMGNLGTIQRTMLGFGIRGLAVIGGGADLWNPKAVRASMGALFQLEVERFPDFPAYLQAFGLGRDIYPFMLDGGTVLTPESCPRSPCYTLVFGNEASGLPPEFQHYGKSLFIDQTDAVDSLNLAVSVAIGTFLFTQKNGRPNRGNA